MRPRPRESRPLGPAFAAFFGAAGAYGLALAAALWLPLHVLGNGPGPQRAIGALLMPGVLLILGWRQKTHGLVLHAALIAAAFAGAWFEGAAMRRLMPEPLLAGAASRALIRMMIYAYCGAALHAAIRNSMAAFRSPAA